MRKGIGHTAGYADAKEVLKLLNGLKVQKSPGPDGMSARVLKG